MKTQKKIIGDLGEGITCNYLKNKGFKLVGRNYWKPWGEIDVIVKKGEKLYFVEVKTVSREISTDCSNENKENVSRETLKRGEYRPEENVHPRKLQRLARVIQSYLMQNKDKSIKNWQFDVAIVYLDTSKKLAKVKYLENIVVS